MRDLICRETPTGLYLKEQKLYKQDEQKRDHSIAYNTVMIEI